MLVILGIGVLLNYLRELSNMGINDFEREFFSDKNINNVHCEHIIYGYYCVLNCINNKANGIILFCGIICAIIIVGLVILVIKVVIFGLIQI